jgi:hypothetical protein
MLGLESMMAIERNVTNGLPTIWQRLDCFNSDLAILLNCPAAKSNA